MSDTRDIGQGAAVQDTLSQVRDAATQAAGQAQQAAQEALGHASNVAQDARDRGMNLAGEAQSAIADAAASQKDAFADRLDQVSEAVQQSGAQLRGKDDFVAGLVERGAAELGTLADALRSNDLQGLLGKVGELARTQPALFVGASLAAGFALARVGRLAAAQVQAPLGNAGQADDGQGSGARPGGLPMQSGLQSSGVGQTVSASANAGMETARRVGHDLADYAGAK